ncbi:hypothetical protein K2X33_15940 [bacterium]|nr:hypothetical protein [bacterium]
MEKTLSIFLSACTLLFVTFACSRTRQNSPSVQYMMTAQDAINDGTSNVWIKNGTDSSVTSYGLFITSYDVNDCSSCFGNIIAGDNVGGTFVEPITFEPNQSLPIGKNYLYNILYNGIYYIRNNAGSSPCALPGCSWPGDDSNVHGWCVSINAMAHGANYNYSNYTLSGTPAANALPYSAAGNSTPFDYQYDLFDPATLGIGNSCIGPIVCDDETLTCSVSSAQTQTFQAY